jgi:hypothetical protein
LIPLLIVPLANALDAASTGDFKHHLRACQCEGFERANERDVRGARLFVRHLRETGATPAMHQADMVAAMPPLFLAFCDWMRQHRGTRDTTLHTYRRTIVDALQTLGSNPQRFDATGLRAFVLDRASRHGRCQARVVITALRVFVRYLIASGECQPGLDAAIPTIAGWRLSSLPRYLPATDVERVLKAHHLNGMPETSKSGMAFYNPDRGNYYSQSSPD